MGGERLPPGARIGSGAEIRHALRRGRHRRAGPVDVFQAESPAGRPRIGVVVPRHGRTVAERNRLKRRLREIARREWLPVARELGASVDVVLRAGPAAYRASFEELETFLKDVFESDSSTDGTAPDGGARR